MPGSPNLTGDALGAERVPYGSLDAIYKTSARRSSAWGLAAGITIRIANDFSFTREYLFSTGSDYLVFIQGSQYQYRLYNSFSQIFYWVFGGNYRELFPVEKNSIRAGQNAFTGFTRVSLNDDPRPAPEPPPPIIAVIPVPPVSPQQVSIDDITACGVEQLSPNSSVALERPSPLTHNVRAATYSVLGEIRSFNREAEHLDSFANSIFPLSSSNSAVKSGDGITMKNEFLNILDTGFSIPGIIISNSLIGQQAILLEVVSHFVKANVPYTLTAIVIDNQNTEYLKGDVRIVGRAALVEIDQTTTRSTGLIRIRLNQLPLNNVIRICLFAKLKNDASVDSYAVFGDSNSHHIHYFYPKSPEEVPPPVIANNADETIDDEYAYILTSIPLSNPTELNPVSVGRDYINMREWVQIERRQIDLGAEGFIASASNLNSQTHKGLFMSIELNSFNRRYTGSFFAGLRMTVELNNDNSSPLYDEVISIATNRISFFLPLTIKPTDILTAQLFSWHDGRVYQAQPDSNEGGARALISIFKSVDYYIAIPQPAPAEYNQPWAIVAHDEELMDYWPELRTEPTMIEPSRVFAQNEKASGQAPFNINLTHVASYVLPDLLINNFQREGALVTTAPPPDFSVVRITAPFDEEPTFAEYHETMKKVLALGLRYVAWRNALRYEVRVTVRTEFAPNRGESLRLNIDFGSEDPNFPGLSLKGVVGIVDSRNIGQDKTILTLII